MSFQTKIIGLFVLLIMIVELVSSYFIYTTASKLIEDATSRELLQVAEAAKRVIDPQMFERVRNKTLNMKNPTKDRISIMAMWEYREIRLKLAAIKDAFRVKYLYTMSRNSFGQNVYIVDGFAYEGSQAQFSPPGELEEIRYDNLENAFDTNQPQMLQHSSDSKWGENFSVFIPIQNFRGELLGVIGVDVEASPLLDLTSRTQKLIIIIVTAVTMIMLLVAWVLTRYLMRPFEQLTLVAKAFRDGDLTVRTDIKSKDEIGQLSQMFDTMLSVVQESQLGMDRMLVNLSRIRRRDDLERQVIEEVKRILKIEDVILLLWSANGYQICQTGMTDLDDLEIHSIQALDSELDLGEPMVCHDGMLIPIGYKRKDAYAIWSRGKNQTWTQRDRLSMQLLARFTAIYFENMDLIEELNQQIQDMQQEEQLPIWMNKLFMQISENERRRLASDLHDEVLQEIVKLRRISATLIDSETLVTNDVTNLKKLDIGLINVNDMIRETCNRLMPSFLMERGIVDAVSELVEKTRLRADFDLQFEAFGSFQMLSDTETISVYRIIQEWISNAINHSQASQVEIIMRQAQQVVTLYYLDNGIGMDLSVAVNRTKHLGMFGVEERVRALGGQFSVRSAKGEGFEMSCQFPLKRA